MSTKSLFEVKKVDIDFYQQKLKNFLPDKIIDTHSHIWLQNLVNNNDDRSDRILSWPARVAMENPIEDLIEGYKLFFPDKEVIPFFCPGNVISRSSIERLDKYCAESSSKYNYPSLALLNPDWDADKVESVIKDGNFLGAKVYLTFAPDYIPLGEIRIFDFLPHHQLEVLNKNNWAVILHIARSKRLGDPVNIAQLLEIENQYPNIQLIVAHVGRAYCPGDVGNAFEMLKDTKNMVFDLAANTSSDVMEMLIDAVGPKRILFGSDEPISRMRMKRICENDEYINLVAKGAYGDLSNVPHMREVPDNQSDKFTFFIYEIIDSFRRAADKTGLSDKDIEDVFYNNAMRIINHAK